MDRARWEDVERFATHSSLGFRIQDVDVVEALESATVPDICLPPLQCGDFGDVPVLGNGPGAAERLGLNVDPLVDALRAAGLPDRPAGAAYVRLRSDGGPTRSAPLGPLIYGRPAVRNPLFVEVRQPGSRCSRSRPWSSILCYEGARDLPLGSKYVAPGSSLWY